MLEPHYTDLIDGYKIKPSQDLYGIVNAKGAMIKQSKSETRAIRLLIERRQGYADGFRDGKAEADRLLQEVLHA